MKLLQAGVENHKEEGDERKLFAQGRAAVGNCLPTPSLCRALPRAREPKILHGKGG